jgi:hypothetical protein
MARYIYSKELFDSPELIALRPLITKDLIDDFLMEVDNDILIRSEHDKVYSKDVFFHFCEFTSSKYGKIKRPVFSELVAYFNTFTKADYTYIYGYKLLVESTVPE